MAADDVQQFLKRAAEVRLARCTPAQRERRAFVTSRNEAIARGVVDLRDLLYFLLSTVGWLIAGVLLLDLKRTR